MTNKDRQIIIDYLLKERDKSIKQYTDNHDNAFLIDAINLLDRIVSLQAQIASNSEQDTEDITKEDSKQMAPKTAIVEIDYSNMTKDEIRKAKARQYYHEHRDKLLQKSKEYQQRVKQQNKQNATTTATPKTKKPLTEEQKRKAREYAKRYREANRELFNARARQYYNDNKEMISQKAQQYREDNREKVNQYARQYRKKRAGQNSNTAK